VAGREHHLVSGDGRAGGEGEPDDAVVPYRYVADLGVGVAGHDVRG
jgi:hypothetical protein